MTKPENATRRPRSLFRGTRLVTTSDTENLLAPINSSRGKAEIQKADPRAPRARKRFYANCLNKRSASTSAARREELRFLRGYCDASPRTA